MGRRRLQKEVVQGFGAIPCLALSEQRLEPRLDRHQPKRGRDRRRVRRSDAVPFQRCTQAAGSLILSRCHRVEDGPGERAGRAHRTSNRRRCLRQWKRPLTDLVPEGNDLLECSRTDVHYVPGFLVDGLKAERRILSRGEEVTLVQVVEPIVRVEDCETNGSSDCGTDTVTRQRAIETTFAMPHQRTIVETRIAEGGHQGLGQLLEPVCAPRDVRRRQAYQPISKIKGSCERQRRKETNVWRIGTGHL